MWKARIGFFVADTNMLTKISESVILHRSRDANPKPRSTMVVLCYMVESFLVVAFAFEVSGEWHRRVIQECSRFHSQYFLFKKVFSSLGTCSHSVDSPGVSQGSKSGAKHEKKDFSYVPRIPRTGQYLPCDWAVNARKPVCANLLSDRSGRSSTYQSQHSHL